MVAGDAVDAAIFEYVIDANDVIVHVNDSWKAFARENGGGNLGGSVIGTWLWQHMAGVEVKHLFRVLLERVRERQKVVRIPFRCDAPDLRRHMMLEVTPLPGNSVRFVSWTEEEEGRPKILLLEPHETFEESPSVRMCAWCKRVKASEGGEEHEWLSGSEETWWELEEALTELNILSRYPLPTITHGVCADCKARVMGELDRVS
ncbi:MAG: hypothetical protein PVJ76_08705 [Gemmatimonadota bacterium]|jgi:hypothetical protein